ncbi:hypothetical protein [Streptomyces sp. NPDC056468]|uniref:hypothetical protein n=1 Tax=Streptomyces sp. NPDC056468 TaxID=3345830 RepID=UPI003697749C
MTDASTGQGNYLYERLTEKHFQRLCAALLAHVHPDARCYPVGYSDGGRDMTRTDGTEAVVYQVKWTSKAAQNPVSWLSAAVKEKADNIRRLVKGGATRYVLITSVAGTGVPGRGSMDRLDAELSGFQRDFNIPMQVWWRSDVDARVVAAPTELKWAYSDMLAGHDLVRYFIHGAQVAAQDRGLRALLMNVIATHRGPMAAAERRLRNGRARGSHRGADRCRTDDCLLSPLPHGGQRPGTLRAVTDPASPDRQCCRAPLSDCMSCRRPPSSRIARRARPGGQGPVRRRVCASRPVGITSTRGPSRSWPAPGRSWSACEGGYSPWCPAEVIRAMRTRRQVARVMTCSALHPCWMARAMAAVTA